MPPTSRGILLIGHGSRDVGGQGEFMCVARALAEQLPDEAVEGCFLELAEPTIESALGRLVARGTNDLVVVPLLLFAAGHARQDIPAAVASAAAGYAGLTIRQTEPLGCEPDLVRLSAVHIGSRWSGSHPSRTRRPSCCWLAAAAEMPRPARSSPASLDCGGKKPESLGA